MIRNSPGELFGPTPRLLQMTLGHESGDYGPNMYPDYTCTSVLWKFGRFMIGMLNNHHLCHNLRRFVCATKSSIVVVNQISPNLVKGKPRVQIECTVSFDVKCQCSPPQGYLKTI